MRRCLAILAVLSGGLHAARAQDLPAAADMTTYQRRAAVLFDPTGVTAATSDLNAACDKLLLMCQAIAAALIIAGMIAKMRKDAAQMEGIASMMLKVAFIALVPALRTQTLETADAAAAAIGYQTLNTNGTPSPVMTSMWGMLAQWVPPGSPYLDALETQSSANPPTSGNEEAWGLHAWNWAKGVGTTTANMFDALWQSISGGLRAGIVFVACGAMVCLNSVTIILLHISELLRHLLFSAGCAILPLFIAGLGIDSFKAQCVRGILAVGSVACWPVGWALVNLVTVRMAEGVLAWMRSVASTALGASAAEEIPPFAVAAPYIGWGILFLFVGATVAICLWILCSTLYAPFAVGRLVSSGGQLAGMVESRSAAVATGRMIAMRPGIVSPPPPAQATPWAGAATKTMARFAVGRDRLSARAADGISGHTALSRDLPMQRTAATRQPASWLPRKPSPGDNRR